VSLLMFVLYIYKDIILKYILSSYYYKLNHQIK